MNYFNFLILIRFKNWRGVRIEISKYEDRFNRWLSPLIRYFDSEATAQDSTLLSSGSSFIAGSIFRSSQRCIMLKIPWIIISQEVFNLLTWGQNLGRSRTSSTSFNIVGFIKSEILFSSANFRSWLEIPFQRIPEIITLVSRTAFIIVFLCGRRVFAGQYFLMIWVSLWLFLRFWKGEGELSFSKLGYLLQRNRLFFRRV